MRTVPSCTRAQAGQRLHQLRLPVALHPGDAQDLARTHLQDDAVHGICVAIVQHLRFSTSSTGFLGLGRLLCTVKIHLRPTISAASMAWLAPAVLVSPTTCATPHDRDPVGQRPAPPELVA